jgi:hypothetical protein
MPLIWLWSYKWLNDYDYDNIISSHFGIYGLHYLHNLNIILFQ